MTKRIEALLNLGIRKKAKIIMPNGTYEGVLFPIIRDDTAEMPERGYAIVFMSGMRNGNSDSSRLRYVPFNASHLKIVQRDRHISIYTKSKQRVRKLPINVLDRGVLPALLESYNFS